MSIGTHQILFVHNVNSLSYTIIPNMNKKVENGVLTEDGISRGIHLYSVVRALATQIENTKDDLMNHENLLDEKKALLQHQQNVTEEILKDLHSKNNSNEQSTDEETGFKSGITVTFNTPSNYVANNIFYDLELFANTSNNSHISDISIKSASQSFNSSTWNIRTAFRSKEDVDILVLPVSNEIPLESLIFKKKGLEHSTNLTTQIKTPSHYADPSLSVQCLLLKRYKNQVQPKFEYLGILKPDLKEKLFCTKQQIDEGCADVERFQFILIMKNEQKLTNGKRGEVTLRGLLREILTQQLFMMQGDENTYTYNSASKGYTSTLFYKLVVTHENITINESLMICDLYCDTTESMVLVLRSLLDELPQQVVAIPSNLADDVMQRRRSVCVNMNKEINHILFNLHEHVKQSTAMNPKEKEIQQDLSEYLKLQIKTDQSMISLLDFIPINE